MFKVGDKVRRKPEYQDSVWSSGDGVFTVMSVNGSSICLCSLGGVWEEHRFELVEEPAKPAVPGIPDGYRLVRIGTIVVGESYVDNDGVVRSVINSGYSFKNYVIVEPVEPVKPKTKKVKMRKYMTKLRGNWLMSTHGEDPPSSCSMWIEVPGSEIEVEVPDDVCK